MTSKSSEGRKGQRGRPKGHSVPEDDALREEERLELLDAVDLLPGLDGVGPLEADVAECVVGADAQVVDQVARHQHTCPTQTGVAVHRHLKKNTAT